MNIRSSVTEAVTSPKTENKSKQIIKIYNEVQRKILLYGESALPATSYPAFRKLVIEAFGHGGAKDKLNELFNN